MTQPDPRTDHEPPSLRAAHRARHAPALPVPVVAGESGDWPVTMRPASPGITSPADPGTTELPLVGTGVPAVAEPPKRGRAGRNLPAAVGVGVLLGGAVLVALLLWKPAFYAVIAAAIGVGTWELTRAVRSSGPRPPQVPLFAGGLLMIGLAWYGGAAALPYGLLGTAVAVLVWRLGDGPAGYQRDVVPALLIAVYVPFLGCFAALLLGPPDGNWRVLAMLVGVVLSDTGGYVAGVFLGRHPMAPGISPKKSWEGFGGSVLASAGGGVVLLYLLFDATWWKGALFGLAMAAAATLGDLTESLLKRDLKIKDMSNLLPGHGGLMDRLDSILLAAPTAYALLTLLTPPS